MSRQKVQDYHRQIAESFRQRELGHEWQRALREGVPEIGWQGDPWLTLAFNELTDEWEVWDEIREEPYLVCKRPTQGTGPAEILQLCAHLRDRDLRSKDGKKMIDEIIARNEKLREEKRKAAQEKLDQANEMIAWDLQRRHMPKDFFAVGS